MKTRPTKEEFLHHKNNQENHRRSTALRDVILGGQDGVVNALGIVLGIAAAGGTVNVLIAAVLAASAAEAISMGAVAFTSAVAQSDHYESELIKEKAEIEKYPEMEAEEVRQIFEQKGFKGKVLEEIVTTIVADKKIWLDTMMREELGLEKIATKNILKSSVIVGVTTAIGSMVPLLPFFFVHYGILTFQIGLVSAVIFSALCLFAVGTYQAITLVGTWWKSGLRMVAIGMSAAFVGYLLATFFDSRLK